MGAQAFINERPITEALPVRKPGRSLDLPLLVTTIALVIFGLVMMFSASWDYSLLEYGSAMYMFEHQVMWLGVGLTAACLLSLFDYHHWRKFDHPCHGGDDHPAGSGLVHE